jgi:uroporphyrinogen III methyltransferase/synthase
MCAETIMNIAGELIASGRRESTPVAIVRWGTYEDQEVFTGTLHDLACQDGLAASEFRDAIRPPAIAIVGEVVSLREKLHWFGRRALEFAAVEAFES